MAMRDRRLECWKRMNAVVDYWTKIEPETADYYMCQFFICYENATELEGIVRSAERSMDNHRRERRGN